MANDIRSAWGTRAITPAEAAEFAAVFTTRSPADRGTIARNLQKVPTSMLVRGMFFEGVFRLLSQRLGDRATSEIRIVAGLPESIVAFREYPHRDFYKLYYLAGQKLYASDPVAVACYRTAQTFFPIFQASFLGRTMGALMGDKAESVLPLMAKAYNVLLRGNSHQVSMAGDRELLWKCSVEPVEWYEDTFRGIIEGAVPRATHPRLRIETRSRTVSDEEARYEFLLRW